LTNDILHWYLNQFNRLNHVRNFCYSIDINYFLCFNRYLFDYLFYDLYRNLSNNLDLNLFDNFNLFNDFNLSYNFNRNLLNNLDWNLNKSFYNFIIWLSYSLLILLYCLWINILLIRNWWKRFLGSDTGLSNLSGILFVLSIAKC
jgi:hypothetical protein